MKTMGSKPPLVLMVVSLVAGCGARQQYQQQPLQQDEKVLYMNDTHENLKKSPEAEVKSEQVQVKQLKNRIQVTMADEILFPKGDGRSARTVLKCSTRFPHPCRASTAGRSSGFYRQPAGCGHPRRALSDQLGAFR